MSRRHLLRLACCGAFVSATVVRGEEALPLVYAARLDGTSLAVDVASSGCTDESYFSVMVEPDGADLFRLSIRTRKQDRCRMAPHIVTVILEVPATAREAKFLLMNRLAAPGALRRSAP
jgi:hypothetical protein